MRTVTWTIAAVATLMAVQSADAWKDIRRTQRSSSAQAVESRESTDRTNYDCREVVERSIRRAPGRNGIQVRTIRECPHTEQMEAGKCESHWFRGMRCTE